MAIARPSVNANKYRDAEDKEERTLSTRKESSVFEDENENETPKVGTSVQSGWDAGAAALESTKSEDYTPDFKFSEEPQLVKFIGDGPFFVYSQHWIERQGKRSFVCLESLGLGEDRSDCPLCDAGDTARSKFAFTIAVISEEGATIQILTAPPSLFRQLKAAHDDSRKGPLNKHYWALSRTGTGPKTQYIIDFVRSRDLAEEWDLDPAGVDAAIAPLTTLDKSEIYVTPEEELVEIAKALR